MGFITQRFEHRYVRIDVTHEERSIPYDQRHMENWYTISLKTAEVGSSISMDLTIGEPGMIQLYLALKAQPGIAKAAAQMLAEQTRIARQLVRRATKEAQEAQE